MNTEFEKGKTTKPGGRQYSSVSALMQAEGTPAEVQRQVAELQKETQLIQRLVELRLSSGLTQEDIAKRLKITQSAVSKLENGPDDDLTIRDIRAYAAATKERFSLLFGRPLSYVEEVKAHAFGIKKSLQALAVLAHKDAELESTIQAFFGEAFFNTLFIWSECEQQIPQGNDVDIRIQVLKPSPRFQQAGSRPIAKVTSHEQIAAV